MKVVLLDNIKGIGQVGDVKDVSDGYARNFLFPRKLGKPASDGAAKEAEAMKAKKLEALSMAKAQSEELAKKLEGIAVVLQGKSNEKGKLFSAITAADIATELSKEAGVHIAPESIVLKEHLKTIGEHTVRISLSGGVTADVNVTIVPIP
jgi:large subunit ribosomal protein L9